MPDLSGERDLLRTFAGWLIVSWHDPVGQIIEIVIGAVCVGAIVIFACLIELGDRDRLPKKAGGQSRGLPPVCTKGHRPRGALFIPLELGNVTVDLQPKTTDTIHTVVGGISGLGKSTLILPLFDLNIGVLTIALDNTRPIAAKVRSLSDGIEWTNEEGSPGWGIGLDLLSGPPRTVSEVLVAGWAAKTSGDTGKWRRAARMRLWKALEVMDATSTPRTMASCATALRLKVGNVEADRACADWADRLETLAMTLGPALGHELDLVDAMRRQQKVLLRLNRFLSPEDAPMLGGMLLVHARRTAQEAGVPFVIIIEEAGQMNQYQEQLTPLWQAGRDRGTPCVLLTQNMSLLPLEVVNNTSVWVSFAQEARREKDFAAERLMLEPDQLQRKQFKDKGRGWAFVRSDEVPTTLVHIRQQKVGKPVLSVTDILPVEFTDVPERTPRYIMREIDLQRELRRGLPMPSGMATRLMDGVYRVGECERWSGKHDRAGHRKGCEKDCAEQSHLDGCYGLAWWPLENPTETRTHEWQRVHRVRWELAFGPLPVDPQTGKKVTLDHRRTCYRDCSRLDHLEPCTNVENVKRRWRVRGVGAAAD